MKRPSGLQLLEGGKPRSIWNTPRWTGVALRDDYDAPIRFLDRPEQPSALCAAAWSVALRTKDGWRIMHRKGARTCPA